MPDQDPSGEGKQVVKFFYEVTDPRIERIDLSYFPGDIEIVGASDVSTIQFEMELDLPSEASNRTAQAFAEFIQPLISYAGTIARFNANIPGYYGPGGRSHGVNIEADSVVIGGKVYQKDTGEKYSFDEKEMDVRQIKPKSAKLRITVPREKLLIYDLNEISGNIAVTTAFAGLNLVNLHGRNITVFGGKGKIATTNISHCNLDVSYYLGYFEISGSNGLTTLNEITFSIDAPSRILVSNMDLKIKPGNHNIVIILEGQNTRANFSARYRLIQQTRNVPVFNVTAVNGVVGRSRADGLTNALRYQPAGNSRNEVIDSRLVIGDLEHPDTLIYLNNANGTTNLI